MWWDWFDFYAYLLDERNRLSRIAATGCVIAAVLLAYAALCVDAWRNRVQLGLWSIGGLAMAWGFIQLGDWWEAREAAKKARRR